MKELEPKPQTDFYDNLESNLWGSVRTDAPELVEFLKSGEQGWGKGPAHFKRVLGLIGYYANLGFAVSQAQRQNNERDNI